MIRNNAKTFLALTILTVMVASLGIISSAEAFTLVERQVNVNSNLFVSANNPKFDNTFAGPQVIEVVISDPDISNVDELLGEPDVTVNGKDLRMVQATDGNWYAYFADRSNAQTADSTVGVIGFGLDYGTFCDNYSDVSGSGNSIPDFTDTVGFAVDSKVIGGVQGTTPIDGNLCTLAGNTNSITHVVREPKNPNELIKPTGQINIDSNIWPIIQLYNFNPTGNVVVQYNKGGNVQTTTLTFDTVDNLVQTMIDDDQYLPNQDVRLTIMDTILNIDPTDEDSWTWASDPVNHAVYYQAFTENGEVDADGVIVNGVSAMQDLTPFLPDLMFEDNGILIVDKNSQGLPANVLVLDDTGNEVLFEDEFGNLRTQTIPHKGFPVTLRELGPNSGTFENFDSTGDANLDIASDAIRGSTATITYNQEPLTVIVEASFCGRAIEDFNVIDGTMSNDVLVGTISDDLIRGFGGNDIIKGKKGNDCLLGGNGDDTLQGGLGDDWLDGGPSFDTCNGGQGTNIILHCEA